MENSIPIVVVSGAKMTDGSAERQFMMLRVSLPFSSFISSLPRFGSARRICSASALSVNSPIGSEMVDETL